MVSMPRLQDDCFATDRDRLTHAQALALIDDRVGTVVGTETVAIAEALNRVLAADVIAARAVPGHANAAVDGYALRHGDYDIVNGSWLPVSGRAAAGRPLVEAPAPGSAVRIFTGAAMPEGTDTVVMQEDARRGGSEGGARIFVPPGLKAGRNRRHAGEDVQVGETVLASGDRPRPQDLAQMASLGLTTVDCRMRLEAAILSSGDEVVRPGATLRHGEVYDANAPMLAALLEGAGATVTDLGIVRDDRAGVELRLGAAARRFRLILTTGGASQGEEDHIAAAVGRLGKRHLWQIAVKPGRPMLFGQIGDCVVLGLPGNPVAVFVCFLLYARPLIARLAGARWREPRRFRLPAGFAFPGKKTDRREYWRGSIADTADGPVLTKYRRDGSGLISSLRAADGLIEVGEAVTGVAEGDLLDFIPFSEFGI